jgi:hypothetical protein
LLNQIEKQTHNHNVTIIISDDKSPDIRYLDLNNSYNNKLTILRSETNNGKFGYWKTVNKVLTHIKNMNIDYLIQLDDDFEVCNNFINQSVDFFDKIRVVDNNILALSLHLNSKIDGNSNRWGLGNSWVDGGAMYSKEALILLNYEIIEITSERWKINKNISSGVWQQVSNRINRMGSTIAKPTYSFLNHNDLFISEMNSKLRIKTPITSYNFIGHKILEDLTIYPINKTIKSNNKKKSVTSSGNVIEPIIESKPIPQNKPEIKSQISSKPQKLFNPEIESKPKPEVKKEQPKPIEPAIEVTPIVKTIEPEQPIVKPEPSIAKPIEPEQPIVKPEPSIVKPNTPQIKSPIKPQPRDNQSKSSISKIPNDLDIGRLRKQRLNFGRR